MWKRLLTAWQLRSGAIVVLLVTCFIAGLIGLLPAYRAVRSWRAHDLARDAVASLEAGDMQAANELAAASLQLEANSATNRRLFAEHFEEAAPEAALLHSHALAAHSEATFVDLRRYVAQCLDQNFAAEAVHALNRLLEQDPEDPANWVLAGEYERTRGNLQEALTHVDRALALQPQLPEAQWLGATLATESTSKEMQIAGRKALWRLAERDDLVGLRALSQLATGALDGGEELRPLVARLASHPLASVAHQLAGERLKFRMAASSSSREALVADCESRYGRSDRKLFLAWLNRIGEPGSVLERLTFEEAQGDRDLCLVFCEAMLATGKAQTLIDQLGSEEAILPIRESTRQFLILESARKLELHDRADRAWADLLQRAESVNPPVSVVSLAQRFEAKLVWKDAVRTYQHLIENYPGEQGRAYDRLTYCFREIGNVKALLEVSLQLKKREPANPIYTHNVAYLSLLTDTSVEESMEALAGLATRHGLVSSVCVRALSLARSGDLKTAVDLVQPLVWESLTPLDQRWVQAILALSDPGHSQVTTKPLRLTLFQEEKAWLSDVDADSVVTARLGED